MPGDTGDGFDFRDMLRMTFSPHAWEPDDRRKVEGRQRLRHPRTAPHEAVQIYELVSAGRLAQAKELYENLVAAFCWDSRNEFVEAIKLSKDMVGHSYGGATRPLRGPLTATNEARVRADTQRAIEYLAQR